MDELSILALETGTAGACEGRPSVGVGAITEELVTKGTEDCTI